MSVSVILYNQSLRDTVLQILTEFVQQIDRILFLPNWLGKKERRASVHGWHFRYLVKSPRWFCSFLDNFRPRSNSKWQTDLRHAPIVTFRRPHAQTASTAIRLRETPPMDAPLPGATASTDSLPGTASGSSGQHSADLRLGPASDVSSAQVHRSERSHCVGWGSGQLHSAGTPSRMSFLRLVSVGT